MPFAVLAAGGCYKWIQLHDAVNKTKQTGHLTTEPNLTVKVEICSSIPYASSARANVIRSKANSNKL